MVCCRLWGGHVRLDRPSDLSDLHPAVRDGADVHAPVTSITVDNVVGWFPAIAVYIGVASIVVQTCLYLSPKGVCLCDLLASSSIEVSTGSLSCTTANC